MQRSDEDERSVDELLAEVEGLTDDSGPEAREEPSPGPDRPSAAESSRSKSTSGGLRSRLTPSRPRLGFRPRGFLVALLLSVVAMFVGGSIPVVGFVGRFLGLLAVGFALGVLSSRRRYLEVGLAGAVASGLGFVLSALTTVFFPFAVDLLAEYGVAVAGLGAATGFLASVVGHYFGRDLREGFSREV